MVLTKVFFPRLVFWDVKAVCSDSVADSFSLNSVKYEAVEIHGCLTFSDTLELRRRYFPLRGHKCAEADFLITGYMDLRL